MLLSVTSDFSLYCLNSGLPTTIIALLIRFRALTCPFALLQLFLTSLGLVFPLFVEVIIIRFFYPRFILLQFLLVPLVGTSIVQIGLGFPWLPKFLHLFRLLHS